MSQEDRNTRVRLVRQIAVPVALGLLGTCENPDLRGANFNCALRDFFEPDPLADAAAAEAAAEPVREAAAGFSPVALAPRPQPATLRDVAGMAYSVMANVDFDGQQSVNPEQNNRLREILQAFKG